MTTPSLMPVMAIDSDAALAAALASLETRGQESGDDTREKESAVRAVLEAVRTRGDAAVAEYTAKFDGVTLEPGSFEVDHEVIAAARSQVDPALYATLERARDNIRRFHEKHLRTSWEEKDADGTVLGQRFTPVPSAGVYVPGGKAFYPSSVLMNVVPAVVAGVPEIVMVSPPSYEGGIHPLVLAAAEVAGATRVFRVGGAQAVAALAYGTETIPAVAKITGPGNIFVTLAKRFVSGVCDIDKEAGPSEVVVIADESTDPRLAAAELLAQGEHEEEAQAVLIATSRQQVEAILAAAEKEMETLSRAAIIRTALSSCGRAFVVRSLEEAAALTNAYAPEHLAIQTADPRALFDQIHHAGCCVLGQGTSVACGDYFVGPNHILPTARSARFASPLTADDFRKVTSIIACSPARMAADADDIIRFATAEAFTAHARAVELRR